MKLWNTIVIFICATALLGAADHPAHHAAPPSPATAESPATPFVREMDADMAKMMTDMHGPGYTGNPDIDFLVMMIPHHQGAIDMARLALIYGNDPLTRSMAEDIIASQQAEINAMKARLNLLRQQGRTTDGEFPTLSGTRGAADGGHAAHAVPQHSHSHE